jgi:hypothetical protein
MKEGSPAEIAQATKIYETIGVYLGYATAQYREFYDFNYFLILGRVTKGAGAPVDSGLVMHTVQTPEAVKDSGV